MKLVPCKSCKYLKRIPVGYVSYKCQCKLNNQLRIWDCYEKPHPKCPLVIQGSKKSNLDMEWIKLNKPKEYQKLLEEEGYENG